MKNNFNQSNKKQNLKIVLTGGGSAGHVIPNIALLDELKNIFQEIHYIGSNGIEKSIMASYPFVTYHEISTVKLIRSITLKNLLIPFKLISSIKQCKKIITDINPNIIFSKGGFVAVPVVLASKKIPVIAHESDFTMGLANKIIYKKCKKMCFSFENLYKKYHKKGVFTGSPIRKDLFLGNKENTIKDLKLSSSKPTVLIMGGSLGAKAINESVWNSIDKLICKFNVIHIVGKNNINAKIKKNGYAQIEFTNDIKNLFKTADIIVSRSGSNSIFEFLALKKPMLLIPLPKTQSRGDQIDNAEYFQKNGHAEILYQENLDPHTLLVAIQQLYQHRNTIIKNMSSQSLVNGTDAILNLIKNEIDNK